MVGPTMVEIDADGSKDEVEKVVMTALHEKGIFIWNLQVIIKKEQ